MPNFASLYAMCEALRFLMSLDRDQERERVDKLSLDLRARVAALGVEMLTPADPAIVSGIVAFAHPDAGSIGAALDRERLIVWAGDSRVRASLHYYNDTSDVDSCTAVLERVLGQGAHAV